MKLPNIEMAVLPPEKIVSYLLSMSHPDGRHKAKFFNRFGFSFEAWEVLANALISQAKENEIQKTEPSAFGTRYIIDGIIVAPDGRRPPIRSVWFIKTGENFPHFVTAYPLQRRT